MMMSTTDIRKGFTIVELLIVIVVIGILASITIVAFNGIQGRANDVAVQSDLTNIGKKIQVFYATYDRWPQGNTDLEAMGISVSKSAYGNHYNTGTSFYNVVYCWPSTTTPDYFAIVAASKSGSVIENRNGTVRKASYAYTGGSTGICASAGSTIQSGSARDWLYSNDAWQPFL